MYYSRQEIFDRVLLHMERQGRRSVAENGIGGIYHAPDGARCAVGLFISEAEYVPEMEGVTVSGLIERFVGALSPETAFLLLFHKDLLLTLQCVHDTWVCERPKWRHLRQAADYHGVNASVVDAMQKRATSSRRKARRQSQQGVESPRIDAPNSCRVQRGRPIYSSEVGLRGKRLTLLGWSYGNQNTLSPKAWAPASGGGLGPTARVGIARTDC